MKVKIGDKEFKVKQATETKDLKKGLLDTDSLPKGEGMLLSFSEPGDHPITMVGMNYPLTLVFANGGKINRVVYAEPGDDGIRGVGSVDSVLEINQEDAYGIYPGQDLKFIGEKNEDGTVEVAGAGLDPKGVAHVLDEDGNVQMNLAGGERIFSRKATERMFDLAKKGDYKKLGKFVIDELDRQDGRKPEYAKN
jgi:uncharacterized membrane protein (UPF0127 family)